ncbi:glycoside hydrolase family 97 catalytic domain-containing protein [Sunxiuqinia sp. sy24]|uniref:glycoside hydrolase family 97 catalytic domain-containing protein n=1 Tax=Sunxiuqinia sp. sy24 TaxID=3461495 RepID=UPI00404567C5
MKKNRVIAILFMCLMNVFYAHAQDALTSPDGRLLFELVSLNKYEAGKNYSTYGEGKYLFYRIKMNNELVVDCSPLGLTLDYTDLFNLLQFVSNSEIDNTNQTYSILHGKSQSVKSQHNQCDYNLVNAEGKQLVLRVRVYNEGVAFCYILPDNYKQERTVLIENTGYQIDPDGKAWLSPYSQPTKWKPSYEMYYSNASRVGEPSSENPGWALPALFQVNEGKHWVMLHEAALTGNYPGTHLGNNCQQGLYNIAFPHPGEALGLYSSLPKHSGIWQMPWRVVMVAEDLSSIVASNMVYDLNESSKIEGDLAWIKPGRASWEWWTTQTHDRDFELQKKFIDLTVEMGWEYYLVDANWNDMKGGTIHQLLDYARNRGVGIFLWYKSGGSHNHVAEQPRGRLWDSRVRKEEFARLKEWGVKGIKVDFFNTDKQKIINQYLDILMDAAAYQLMVNFHGCTVPRGWSKTYPNLMSMEAVKGEETYGFDPVVPEKAPEYNAIVAFTRAAIGPADYTPVAFSEHNYPHLTTKAHELALTLIFQSGLVHFADAPEVYRNQSDEVRHFLKELPAQFDEVRLLGGFPGEYAAIARRKGDSWYVGIISGKDHRLSLKLDLALLGVKKGKILEISDSDGELKTNEKPIKNSTYSKEIAPYGGVVLVIQPN